MSDFKPLRMQPVRDRRPLSVQVYDQLVEALRNQGQPGDPIPPEVELAAELGVSRTVLREALRLLEEDGVIERGGDPRRRQLAAPSSRPPSFTAPLEDMLHGPHPISIEVIRTEPIAPTVWSRTLLELDEGEDALLCRESLLIANGEPVASALEIIPSADSAVPAHLVGGNGDAAGGQTLLTALGAQFRSKCVPTVWRISAASASAARANFSRTQGNSHLTNLTVVLSRNGRPVFLAKHLVRLDLVALSVGEPSQKVDFGLVDPI